MGKIKNMWEAIGRHKYAVTIIGFLLIICVFDQNNLIQRLRHQRQIRDQSMQGLLELANDSNNLERIAREKYGMHLPNEEVFIIE